jgi:DNA-binding transcriptional MerR regulator
MEEQKKMKTTNKKLVSGLLIGLFITAIGAVLVTAQTDDSTEETIPTIPFDGRHKMEGFGPFAYNLTDDQQAEIDDLIATLRQENATYEEIQSAIQEKLDEFGVLDAQLENEIARTQQQLTILNRQKELRDQGYSWDEINSIIQDEFNLENTTYMGYGMAFDHGFGPGPCGGGGPHEFMPGEEIEQ